MLFETAIAFITKDCELVFAAVLYTFFIYILVYSKR